MPEQDIVEIMRDKAVGRRNEVGDKWVDEWCADAADEIERLRGELDTAVANLELVQPFINMPKGTVVPITDAETFRLRAERDRYRRALEAYASGNTNPAIARTALQDNEGETR